MLKLFNNEKEIETDINTYLTKIFPLENFSAFGLEMNGIYFKTGEHVFQYLKFSDEKICDEIINCNSPYDARILGGKYKSKRIPNWSIVKYDYLEKVFKLKLEQNPMVKEALLATKDYLICEYCVDEDTEWGLDKNGNGENKLGQTWMKIRDEIRALYEAKRIILNLKKIVTNSTLSKEQLITLFQEYDFNFWESNAMRGIIEEFALQSCLIPGQTIDISDEKIVELKAQIDEDVRLIETANNEGISKIKRGPSIY